MYYFPLVLFFTSLVLIIVMISRKLIIQGNLLENGEIVALKNEFGDGFLNLKEWRQNTIEKIKKYSHIGIIEIIRLYVRTVNLLKSQYRNLKLKINQRFIHNHNKDDEIERPVSKFLKTILEYKNKIREIKHQIKEEEKENL